VRAVAVPDHVHEAQQLVALPGPGDDGMEIVAETGRECRDPLGTDGHQPQLLALMHLEVESKDFRGPGLHLLRAEAFQNDV
jgi:hypothetical protein